MANFLLIFLTVAEIIQASHQVDTIVPKESSSDGTDTSIDRFEIRFSNGLEIHHGEISYRSFCPLIEKLELLTY